MSLVEKVHLVMNTFLDRLLEWLTLLHSTIDQNTLSVNQYNGNKLEVENLMKIQQELQQLQKEAIQHQSIVGEIQDIKQEITLVNKSCIDTVVLLQQQSNLLEKLLLDAKKLVQFNDDTDNGDDGGGVDCHELLCYAQRVSKHTLQLLEPPIPQEHIMRMSLLFKSQFDTLTSSIVNQEQVDTVVDVIDLNHVNEIVESTMDRQLLDLDLF